MNSISVKKLSKMYVLGEHLAFDKSFREVVSEKVSSWFKTGAAKDTDNTHSTHEFMALKEVSFDIPQGDIVGVIGHNGAGKSTLLKVLSRITAPTDGEVRIYGRVASLLEVGTGFHPELTGRENIYLNGAILGMSRNEIDASFDDIVAFAGVERFLETPVKRYSSGMYVRLAFSVAAHLNTDVLLVDEVLAVGDQDFQNRCFSKLDEVSGKGRTIMFVSHNLSAIAKLCNKVMVMNRGKLVYYGDVTAGISAYNQQLVGNEPLSDEDYTGDLFPDLRFNHLRLNNREYIERMEIDPSHDYTLSFETQSTRELQGYQTSMSIRRDGILLFTMLDSGEALTLNPGMYDQEFTLPAFFLLPGEYTFSLGATTNKYNEWTWTRDYAFIVGDRWAPDYDSTSPNIGMVNIRSFGSRSKK